MPAKILLSVITVFIFLFARNQVPDSSNTSLRGFPLVFFDHLDKNASGYEKRLTKHINKYLQRMAKAEARLQRKWEKIDSASARSLFNGSAAQYARLQRANAANEREQEIYIPYLDSLMTGLSFLEQNSGLLSSTRQVQEKIKNSLSGLRQLQSCLGQAEQVKQFIRQRKQQINEMLWRYTAVPNKLTRELKDFNKEVYYYSARLRELRAMLNEPEKLIHTGLSLLNKLPAFSEFMQKHSLLASIFRLPGRETDPASLQAILSGLQTRTQVQQMVNQQVAAGGPNAMAQLQMNIQESRSKLDQLKSKINAVGSGGTGDDMPDFRPNNEKVKSFLNRLELGTDLQTTKGNNYFPVTTDLALSVGYRLNDRSVIGLGASYKMGWGHGWRDLKITHQGAGLRSFVNWKLKGSLFLSGGYEMNYRNEFNRIEQLKSMDAWQQSGLLGLSKSVSIRSKFFKKTRVTLLFDFLSYQQVPRTQPVLFRVGYQF